MAHLGTFIVGLPAYGAGTGSVEPEPVEPEPTVITVPAGTAQAFADRAAQNPYLDVTVMDPNTVSVLVTLPTTMTPEDFNAFSDSMLFALSGDIPFGWFSITAKGVLGLADSGDSGSTPDYIPVVGTVTFFPSFAKPIKIVSQNAFLAISGAQATFDSDGELSYDGVKGVRLISPQWDDLSDNAWTWKAQVRPGPGQSWEGFDATFTAAPGATVDLVDFL